MNNIKFNSYQDADDIAPYIKDYYFSDTLIGIKLELTESEILDYLYELGYKGDDRGKFLDMVISSLVNIGVTIKQDDENYNEDNDMPFLKASMGIILPDDGFKVTFTNPLNNKTFMGSNSMEEWQDYLRNMSEYERRDAIVTSIKYGHEIKVRGELPEDYFYNNGGEIQITKDDFINNREISVGMGVKVVLKKTETNLYVAEDYMLNESGVWERYGLIGSKNYQDVVNELNNIIKNKGYDKQFEKGGSLTIDDYINKRYRRNDTYDDLSFVSKNFYRTTESMIREHLQNGEICVCKLEKILGKTPDYPSQVVGSLKLTKCFLRPYYKI